MNFKSFSKKLLSALVVIAMMLPFGISAAFAAEVTSVTVELSAESITLGESVDVFVKIDGADFNTETVITANGKTETIKGDYYKFSHTPTSDGENEISAESGSKRGSAKIYVDENDAPVVELGSYADGKTIRTQLLAGESLTATATDNGEVAGMEILVDGTVFKTAQDDEISVSFSEIGLGTFEVEFVAYDEHGLKGSAGITANILNEQMVVPVTADEKSGIKLENGRTKTDAYYSGYAEYKNLEDGNVVVAIGADDGCIEQTNKDYSRADIGVSTYVDRGGVLSFEFDVYYENCCQEEKDMVRLELREQLTSGANLQGLFVFRTSTELKPVLKLEKSNDAAIMNYDMELQKWYHIRVLLDWQHDLADVYITPSDGIEVQLADDVETKLKGGDGNKPNLFRMGCIKHNNTKKDYGDIYFDNFQLTTVHTPPNILSITECAEEVEVVSGEVPYDAKKLTAKVSVAPVTSSITTDTVYLLDAAGNKIVPESVEYVAADYAINIELANALEPDSTYQFVLDKTMKMTSAFEFGADVKKSFKVSKAGCYAEEDDTKWYYAGDDAICQTTVVNSGGEAETAYVLRSVWYVDDEGHNVAETVVDEITLETGNNPLQYTIKGAAREGDADMYIISDLMDPMIFANISK